MSEKNIMAVLASIEHPIVIKFADSADQWRSPFPSPTSQRNSVATSAEGRRLFHAGRRRGSQGHRAGEAWPGPNRWPSRRVRHVPRTRVACTNLTAEQQRKGCMYFCTIRT